MGENAVSCDDARAADLDGTTTPEIEEHIAGCDGCAFQRGLRALAADDVDPPDPALDATARSDAPAPSTVPAGALPDALAGRYELADPIGQGGLGRVLRARDRVLGRTIAIKEVLRGDDDTRRRFVREALITARLQHPAIVPVYDAARWADRAPFFAMKLVDGRPLTDVIARAPDLEARLALVPTVLAVADAIAYAHGERIIHRDLKPHNVMVGAYGETVVIDWGLAKDLAIDDKDAGDAGPYRAAAADRTAAGTVVGTPAYMPPEQADGADVDERADVYAIGAILAHVITGRAPVEGVDARDVLERVKRGEVVRIAEREPRVPADLAAIAAKAMAHAPADRYPTARELAADLRRFVSGQLVAVHRYRLGELVRRWARRHRIALSVAAVAAVVLAGFGAWSIRRILAETRRADEQRERRLAAARDAEVERVRAVAGSNYAKLYRARTLVERDPGAALVELAGMAPLGPGWDAARVIAAEARSRPRVIATANLRDADGRVPIETSKWTVDAAHGRAFAWSWGNLWIVELATGAVRLVDAKRPLWPDAMVACADGKRLAGGSPTTSGQLAIVELDLAAAAPREVALDRDAAWDFIVGCRPAEALRVDAGALEWWGDGAGAPRVVAHDITAATLTADRGHAIATDAHGAAHILDLRTGAVQLDVAAIPDAAATGTVWFVGRDGGWVVLVDATGRATLRRGPRFEREQVVADDVESLELSDDARWLVGRDAHGQARAWDMDANAWPVAIGDGEVVAASPAGPDRAATRSGDGTVRLWTLPSPRMILADADSVTMSPDGRWIVDETDAGLRRVDADDPRAVETTTWPIERPPLATVRLLRAGSVAPSGDVLARIGDDLWIWRRGGTWERQGRGPDEGAAGEPRIGWSSAGAAFAWSDHEIVAWDRTGEHRTAVPPVGRLIAVRDDLVLAAAVDGSGGVMLVDVAGGGVTPLPGSKGGSLFDGNELSRDGRALLTADAGGDGWLVWTVASARPTAIARGDARQGGIVLSDDASRAALFTPTGGVVIDVATGARHALDTGSRPTGVFDPTGAWLVTASETGVRVFDVESGEGRLIAAVDPDDVRLLDVGAAGVTVAISRGVFRFPLD